MSTVAVRSSADRLTAEQLAEIPDESHRHELVDGQLLTLPFGSWQHGLVTAAIGARVGKHVDDHRLGRCFAPGTGFLMRRDPDTVRAPDLAFISGNRPLTEEPDGFSEEVPDLVAEVASPSDRASEVTQKALVWLDYGVRLVWIIDPRARVVTVHQPGDVIGLVRGDDAVLDGGQVLPGFQVALSDLFS